LLLGIVRVLQPSRLRAGHPSHDPRCRSVAAWGQTAPHAAEKIEDVQRSGGAVRCDLGEALAVNFRVSVHRVPGRLWSFRATEHCMDVLNNRCTY
jgi:hypothetical protein